MKMISESPLWSVVANQTVVLTGGQDSPPQFPSEPAIYAKT